MEFRAETLRLTPLDTQHYLIDRECLVLADMSMRVTTGHETKADVTGRWGEHVVPRDQPTEWETVRVELFRAAGAMRFDLADVLGAVTRTGATALEAWGPYEEASGTWPYLVMPAVDYEGQGACVATTRDAVDFSGYLFDGLWGMSTEPWYEPRDSDGLYRRFDPVISPMADSVWGHFRTDVPPPTSSGHEVWDALLESDWFLKMSRYYSRRMAESF